MFIKMAIFPLIFCLGTSVFAIVVKDSAIPRVQISPASTDEEANGDDKPEKSLIEPGTLWESCNKKIAWNLYRQLQKQPGNLIFSPVAISEALAFLYSASIGQTQREIANVLGTAVSPEELLAAFISQKKQLQNLNSRDSSALLNAIWIQRGLTIQKQFEENEQIKALEVAMKIMNFTAHPLTTRDTINEMITNSSSKQIRNIINTNDIGASTRLIFTSAANFSLPWEKPFEKRYTYMQPFFSSTKYTSTLATMHLTQSVNYYESEELIVFLLPYKSSTPVAFLIAMPKVGHDLASIENKMSQDLIETWLHEMKKKNINLSLPIFSLRNTILLKNTLMAIGIRQLFGEQADLSNMLSKTTHKEALNSFYHQSFYSIQESGSNVNTSITSEKQNENPSNSVTVQIDHPFFFALINTQTRVPFLLGRIVSPMQSER